MIKFFCLNSSVVTRREKETEPNCFNYKRVFLGIGRTRLKIEFAYGRMVLYPQWKIERLDVNDSHFLQKTENVDSRVATVPLFNTMINDKYVFLKA